MNFQITKEQSRRFNILKLLFALFVVYIHCNPTEVKLSEGVFVSEMPRWFDVLKYTTSEIIPRCSVFAFFLMASILLYRKDFSWGNNIKRKIKSLLIPYFIMNTLWIIIFAVFQAIPQTMVFFGNKSNSVAYFNWFRWLQAYGICSEYPVLYPLWFIRNLFVLNLIAPLIKKVLDFLPKYTDIACLSLVFLFLPTTNCIYFNVTDVCAWCFGYLIVKHKANIDFYDNKQFIVAPLYIIILIARIITYGVSIPVFTIMLERITLLISVVFWYSHFSKQTNGSLQRIFIKYSKYNFGIYIFHEMNLTFSTKLITKIFGMSIPISALEYLFLPPTIVCLVIILCIVINKYFPKIFALITGARISQSDLSCL